MPKNQDQNVVISLRVPKELHARLKTQSEYEDRPLARVLRHALEKGLETVYGETWASTPDPLPRLDLAQGSPRDQGDG